MRDPKTIRLVEDPERRYAEAWKQVCQLLTKHAGGDDMNELLIRLYELSVLYGDPNIPPPAGVIHAPSQDH